MVKLRYKGKNLYRACGVTLLPGINRVDDEVAERFLAHPLVKLRLEDRTIEVVGQERESTESDDAPAVPVSELLDEIKETYDVARLRELLKDERKTVQKAAQKQLDRIDETARAEQEPSNEAE